jgi:type IV pilus assembly protein PilA
MIVVAILATLAAIAIPQFVKYRQDSYDKTAAADIRNAFAASQTYFIDYPSASISLDGIKESGYRQTKNIQVKILNNQAETFEMEVAHERGGLKFIVDANGKVESSEK